MVRLAFDCTYALSPPTGVGTFAAAVLSRLVTRPDIDVTGYAVAWRESQAVAEAVGPSVPIASRCDVLSPRYTRALWRRSNRPPIEWITGRVDVVHSPNFIVPPARRAAMVATVHDLTFIHHPELCTPDTRDWYPALITKAIERGAWLHAVSGFVRDELVEFMGASPDRVVVVPNATDPLPPADAADGTSLAGAERFVLALGTVEPRKNLPRLIAAWDRVADTDPDLHLVIAGAPGWGSAAVDAAVITARHGQRIKVLGWIDATQRSALLRAATMLAYPSLYEGFGIPPLEAMSVGTPVLAGAVGAVMETCADAAVYVDPADTDDIAAGMVRLLTDDAERAGVTAAGLARVSEFSWDRTTDGIVGLYRTAIAGR
jgi:glycosyltransferase involved in cell wall biosynthesis